MQLPDSYINYLGFNSVQDIIENLYLKSLINAYPKVAVINGITNYNENSIRNEFQRIICFGSEKLSELINSNLISLSVENQIWDKNKERRRTDIEFNIPKLKYVIECKKIETVSKQQYIDNGIRRFVGNIYISKNEEYAGMCSFVVNDDIFDIISGIKKKVKVYNFVSIDENNICNFKHSFSSEHNRPESNNIKIYHLFFNMKKKHLTKYIRNGG